MMKKILLLGGSAQQVIAIKTAKNLGYYTVLCDFLKNNPGQYEADKFYLVSTTDKEAVLKVAVKEMVDGVLAFASDPAAPTAAYVADKLGLPSNPYESVEILCNKDKFRDFLSQHGFNAPKSMRFTEKNDVLKEMHKFSFPIIIKPVDSSGSKGVTVLYSPQGIDEAIDLAYSFSRAHRIIVEDFIEKKHKYLVGGDVFVEDGKVILWGLLNCHRDGRVNPLVPVGKSYPLYLDENDIIAVKRTIQELISHLNLKFGAINVELIVDKKNKVWLIDVGPRAGGNMIPDLLGLIFDTDVVKLSVLTAMGEAIDVHIKKGTPFFATHNLHSDKNGIYQGIEFSPEIERYIIKKYFYKNIGEDVRYFSNAADALGIIFMKFETKEEMQRILEHINDFILVKVNQK